VASFRIGIASALTAQIMWGLFPIYWKWLAQVPPLEVLSHRNLWCAVCLGLLVLASAERRRIVAAVMSSGREVLQHLFAASLLAGNWLVYIWAVVNDHVIDASLGYFLSPLVSVALGYFVFRETLDFHKRVAVALAVAGVLIMVVVSGVLPWIGLTLAATFGLYGMVRKKASTGPINGLFVETVLLVLPTFVVLWWLAQQDALAYQSPVGWTEILLAIGGLVTALPLVLYAQGARSLPLSLSGLLVYVTPSIQFLIGWIYYQEPISGASWVGFICIWLALGVYSASLVRSVAQGR
jgi:chloramphenicol-sensitive protein RarD